jgi:hypothetical protein
MFRIYKMSSVLTTERGVIGIRGFTLKAADVKCRVRRRNFLKLQQARARQRKLTSIFWFLAHPAVFYKRAAEHREFSIANQGAHHSRFYERSSKKE